jgi:hypothetical protein
MHIKKKNLEQLIKEIETALNGRKQGDVVILPIGFGIFPNRLSPQIEIVLLEPGENIIAYRQKSHPEGLLNKQGTWMIGKPAAVAGVASQWAGKMIEQKEEGDP